MSCPKSRISEKNSGDGAVTESKDGGSNQPDFLKPLGTPGAPLSIEESYLFTNPNYEQGEPFQKNCQRCVYTYEMRRRGYDVEALPRKKGIDSTAASWRSIMQGQEWEKVGSKNSDGVANKIAKRMQEWGVGARAVVYVQWKKGRSAHVFIAEQTAKGLRYIEPQTGEKVGYYYFAMSKPMKTEISRIDHLQPSEKILGCMKASGT